MAEMCYTAVMRDNGYSLGIVKDGETGYYATNYPSVPSYKEAQEWARDLNEKMEIDPKEEARLVLQSMRRC